MPPLLNWLESSLLLHTCLPYYVALPLSLLLGRWRASFWVGQGGACFGSSVTCPSGVCMPSILRSHYMLTRLSHFLRESVLRNGTKTAALLLADGSSSRRHVGIPKPATFYGHNLRGGAFYIAPLVCACAVLRVWRTASIYYPTSNSRHYLFGQDVLCLYHFILKDKPPLVLRLGGFQHYVKFILTLPPFHSEFLETGLDVWRFLPSKTAGLLPAKGVSGRVISFLWTERQWNRMA